MINGVVFGLAICADSLNEGHIAHLKQLGVNCCLAPSLISHNGYDHDLSILKQYSAKYGFCIAVSNYVDQSGGFHAAGKSVIIHNHAEIIAQASISEVGFVVADL